MDKYKVIDSVIFSAAWIYSMFATSHNPLSFLVVTLLPIIFTAGWIVSNLVNGDVWHLGM